jgi:hypothetical protein
VVDVSILLALVIYVRGVQILRGLRYLCLLFTSKAPLRGAWPLDALVFPLADPVEASRLGHWNWGWPTRLFMVAGDWG